MQNSIKDYFKGQDETQISLMKEMCIEVTPEDEVIGSISKEESHLMVNINKGKLHRAFSVFLFSPDGKLLLQKRASEKITFPNCWTNTCCSHPLFTEKELITENNLGVKNAAIRKLEHELGITKEQVPIENFTFLTKVHYLAASDPTWGEHEVDHILFIVGDIKLNVNSNEVSDTKYVDQNELKNLIEKANNNEKDEKNEILKITPWFNLIAKEKGLLWNYWDQIKQRSGKETNFEIQNLLTSFVDSEIHKFV